MAAAPPALTAAIDDLRTATAARDRDRTNAAVARLLAMNAPLGPQWRALSQLMLVSGELTLAHATMNAFVAASGNSAAALFSKVVLLTQSGKLREAHSLIGTLPVDVPDRAGRAYVLGNTAVTLGRVEEGREQLGIVLRERPGWGPAWLSLAATGNLATDPLGDKLLADAKAAEKQAPGDLARYCYALGKLHADRGDHAASFAAYDRGARLLRSLTPYSRAGNEANAREAMTGFDGDLLERMRDRRTTATDRPIFVTGLPRSGTTLVEQILASHSSVVDGGEISLAHHVAVATGGVSGDAIERHLANGGSIEQMAGLYLHLLGERFGGEGRVVDKTIDNSRFLGLIAAMLPDAPLVWMRRDPLDSAWSCFRTFFIHGVAWSYSLTDIAHHFLLEDRLLAFWKQRLGDRLLVVPFTEFVEAPEPWIGRLLAHCGLSEEQAAYAAHATDRVVATASGLQVRRPINRDVIGVAAPYRAQLQPFVDAYGAG
jgi:hypothetical protein